MTPPICPTSDTVTCVVGGSSRVASSCSITITLGCDVSIIDTYSVYTDRVADRSVYAIITIGAMIVAGYTITITDASRTPASCCPPVEAITAIDGTYHVDVAASVDSRHTT
jgi:hypothetical protein